MQALSRFMLQHGILKEPVAVTIIKWIAMVMEDSRRHGLCHGW